MVGVEKSAELAKLYGNRSAAFYQLALAVEAESGDCDEVSDILQHALDDGLKSVELDASYEKGHFRLHYITLHCDLWIFNMV